MVAVLMLDKTNFDKTFALLAKHYSYDVSLAIAKIYYDYLSANLEEAEYLQAIELVVLHHPVRMKLPSPVQIVELIRGSKESKAYQEWQIILKAGGSNDVDQLTYLSTRGHIALSAIGGLSAVAYCEGSLVWLQKDFTSVYCECSDKDVHILKPVKIKNPLPNYIADVENPISAEQLAELRERIKRIGQ